MIILFYVIALFIGLIFSQLAGWFSGHGDYTPFNWRLFFPFPFGIIWYSKWLDKR